MVHTSHSYTMVTADSRHKHSCAYVIFSGQQQVDKLIQGLHQITIEGKNLEATLCTSEMSQTPVLKPDGTSDGAQWTTVETHEHEAPEMSG